MRWVQQRNNGVNDGLDGFKAVDATVLTGVKKHSALATDLDRGRPTRTAIAVEWSHVNAAVRIPSEVNVTMVAPEGSPRVPHDPVWRAVVVAITYQLHQVVKVRVGLVAARENPRLVIMPAGVPMVCQRLHQAHYAIEGATGTTASFSK